MKVIKVKQENYILITDCLSVLFNDYTLMNTSGIEWIALMFEGKLLNVNIAIDKTGLFLNQFNNLNTLK